MARLLSLTAAAVVTLASDFCPAQVGEKLFERTGLGIPIPDIGQLADGMSVPADGTVLGDLSVGILIPHTWQGDLTISLVAPWGGSILLFDRPGSPQVTIFGFSADNFGDPASGAYMWFGDGGTSTYDPPAVGAPGIPNVTGLWRAEGGSLAAFVAGHRKAGTWTLQITDIAAGDIGTLEAWALRFTNIPSPSSAAMIGLAALGAARRQRRGRGPVERITVSALPSA